MFLFFDTETTGTNRSKDHIVQLAWILAGEDYKEIARASHIIKPDGYSIPPAATAVHGITTARATREGRPLNSVLSEFAKAGAQAKVVVAHNLSFDEAFVRRAYEDEYFRDYPLSGKKKVCTMKETTTWCRLPKPSSKPGYKWPKLEELHAKVFRRPFDNPHDALADTQACMACFFELLHRKVLEPPFGRTSSIIKPTEGIRSSTDVSGQPRGAPKQSKQDRSQQRGDSNRKTVRLWLSREHDRHYLAKSSKATTEQLERLLEYDDMAALALAAKNPNATTTLVQKILERLRQDDLFALLEDEGLSIETLAALAVHRDIKTVHGVCKHPRCNSQILQKVINRLMWGQTGWESLVVTASALGIEAVLSQVLAHPETPDDFLDEWFWAWVSTGQWMSGTIEADDPQAVGFTQNPNSEKRHLAELAWLVPYGGSLWQDLNNHSRASMADLEDSLSELVDHGTVEPIPSKVGSDVRQRISTEHLHWEHTDPRLLSRLATLQDRLVQHLLACHPNSPSDVVYTISERAYLAMRGLNNYYQNDYENEYSDPDGIAKRGGIGFDTILSAALTHAAHPIHLVRSANCSANILKQYEDSALAVLRGLIAGHKNSTGAILSSLAEDPEREVRELLAQNQNCTAATLITLLKDEESQIRVMAAQAFISRREAISRKVQEAFAKNACAEVRLKFLSLPTPDRDLLFRLTNDPDGRVRKALATSAKVGSDLLERFADDPWWEVREQVLCREDCPASFVARIASDPSTQWRLAAASSSSGPAELFELLASDPNESVRRAVMNNSTCPVGIRLRLFEETKQESDGVAGMPPEETL